MAVAITSTLCAEMVRAAEEAAPLECCGLLLGQGDTVTAILPAANISDTPDNAFLIDPVVLVQAQRAARQGGPDILGHYHSHPNGRSEPSERDQAQALPDGRLWAIIASGKVRFWRALPDQSGKGGAVFVPEERVAP
ncbi:M67 family metallopeptidase [Alterisphingorhabdus coralli]|uniref:M67 family metallopeptidase n=1 Tax=Alterisphingorhabdus coralli TaxID=3071408 RepID=A0AA97F9H5_9SPHN|nr:M67 family metallopeptidase [Parasphingorhabdus sp. SCSIO 66989]WOE76453.1 M67 family metallopeptidase [Parasphingorhabdus sp. SCSIO 66989]